MDFLKQATKEIEDFIRLNRISMKLIFRRSKLAVRAGIVSRPLGGILAVGYEEDGIWLPCYPQHPEYSIQPTKGSIYLPHERDYPPPRACWIKALKAALNPKQYLYAEPHMQEIAEERAAYLRDPIRVAVMLILIEQFEDNMVQIEQLPRKMDSI